MVRAIVAFRAAGVLHAGDIRPRHGGDCRAGQYAEGLVTAASACCSRIGYDPITGMLRFGMGSSNYLWDGSTCRFFVSVFAVAK